MYSLYLSVIPCLMYRAEAAGSDAAGAQKKAGQTKSRKPEVVLSISVGEFR